MCKKRKVWEDLREGIQRAVVHQEFNPISFKMWEGSTACVLPEAQWHRPFWWGWTAGPSLWNAEWRRSPHTLPDPGQMFPKSELRCESWSSAISKVRTLETQLSIHIGCPASLVPWHAMHPHVQKLESSPDLNYWSPFSLMQNDKIKLFQGEQIVFDFDTAVSVGCVRNGVGDDDTTALRLRRESRQDWLEVCGTMGRLKEKERGGSTTDSPSWTR